MLNQLKRVLLAVPLFAAIACSSMHRGGGGGSTAATPKPEVQVQFPENWKVESPTAASTPDGCSLIIMRIEKKSPADVISSFPQSFASVFRDVTLNNDTEDTTVNGLKALKITGRGHRNERGARFTAVLVASKDNAATDAVIAVGPETMYKQHMRDIDNALDTIKPTAQ